MAYTIFSKKYQEINSQIELDKSLAQRDNNSSKLEQAEQAKQILDQIKLLYDTNLSEVEKKWGKSLNNIIIFLY